MSFAGMGLLDEPAHLATALIILGALVRIRGFPPDQRFGWTMLACSVLVDLDHLPAKFGYTALTNSTPRPYTHALWTVIVLTLAWGAARFVTARSARPRPATAELILAGAACGVTAHFVRDLATGPMSFWWPVSYAPVQAPYWCYVVALAAIILVGPIRRRRQGSAEITPEAASVDAPGGSRTDQAATFLPGIESFTSGMEVGMPLLAKIARQKKIIVTVAVVVLAVPVCVIALSQGNPSSAVGQAAASASPGQVTVAAPPVTTTVHASPSQSSARASASQRAAVHAGERRSSVSPSSSQASPVATDRSPLFGTLDTQLASINTDKQAGVSVAMFELNWASFEPTQGQFDASYISGMKAFLTSYLATGMQVTLGLGLDDPPSWVFSLPDGNYVNESGAQASEADFVFSQAVRQAAAVYLQQVAAALPLSDFWAIRLTSGGDEEMLYPAGGSYWAYSQSALTGADLPPTMTANPFPNWRPGQSGLTQSQVDQWVNWYVGGLDDVTAWQMRTLFGLGFTGYYQLVTPGSGTRPDALAAEEKSNLPDNAVTGVGAVWDRYYAMLPAKSKVVAYISSVADMSGNDDSCQASDESLPLTSPEMDSWSATRWISRVAAANGLLVAGENPGYGQPASLDSHYEDTSSQGMMADAIRQATTCKFQVFYWAHDEDFASGVIPLSRYQQDISAARS